MEGTWSLRGCWQEPEGSVESRGTPGWGEPRGGGGLAAVRWATGGNMGNPQSSAREVPPGGGESGLVSGVKL